MTFQDLPLGKGKVGLAASVSDSMCPIHYITRWILPKFVIK